MVTTAPATTTRFSTLAIVAFVLAFFVTIVGAIIGVVAVVRINRTGERGKGLAIAAIIIGVVLFVSQIAFFSAGMHMMQSGALSR